MDDKTSGAFLTAPGSHASHEAPTGLRPSGFDPSRDETTLLVSDADRPRAYLDLSDEVLGRFTRKYLIQCQAASEKLAAEQDIPLSVIMSLHGAISLYRICDEANAATMTLEHDGVTWGRQPQGDWKLTIERLRDSDGSGDAGVTGTGTTEGNSAGPQDIAHPSSEQSS